MTTLEELDKLEKLYKEATQGVWFVRSHPRLKSFIQAPRVNPDDPYDIELLGEDDTLYPTRDQDMAFIVAMHEQFPALIAAARRALGDTP